MNKSFELPPMMAEIYPNPIQYVYETPVVIYRDHRWILPVLFFAGKAGKFKLPVRIITFDRHRDSLLPVSKDKSRISHYSTFSPEELVKYVRNNLSPRDDDWIVSGMELGLISDVVHFSSESDESEFVGCVTEHPGRKGIFHRIYHLGRLSWELAYKGALTDSIHEAVSSGLWDVLGWQPDTRKINSGRKGYVLDVDLDYFTISWDMYTFPYTIEVYEGEFIKPCQSVYYDDYRPLDFIRELVRNARILTVAGEPQFCGGAEKAQIILEDCNRILFENQIHTDEIDVDYIPQYPSE